MACLKHYLFKKLNVPEPKSLENLAQFIREHVKGDRRQVKMSVDIDTEDSNDDLNSSIEYLGTFVSENLGDPPEADQSDGQDEIASPDVSKAGSISESRTGPDFQNSLYYQRILKTGSNDPNEQVSMESPDSERSRISSTSSIRNDGEGTLPDNNNFPDPKPNPPCLNSRLQSIQSIFGLDLEEPDLDAGPDQTSPDFETDFRHATFQNPSTNRLLSSSPLPEQRSPIQLELERPVPLVHDSPSQHTRPVPQELDRPVQLEHSDSLMAKVCLPKPVSLFGTSLINPFACSSPPTDTQAPVSQAADLPSTSGSHHRFTSDWGPPVTIAPFDPFSSHPNDSSRPASLAFTNPSVSNQSSNPTANHYEIQRPEYVDQASEGSSVSPISSYESSFSDSESNDEFDWRQELPFDFPLALFEVDTDPNDAYNQYLRCRALPPRPENQTNAFFTSNDPRENRDNSPTRWGSVRVLSNDDERKKFARQQFGNRDTADPTRNLTYHGHRRKRYAGKNGMLWQPRGGQLDSTFLRISDGNLEYIDNFNPVGSDASSRKRKRGEKSSRSVMIPFHDFETALIRKVMPMKIPNMTTVCVRDVRQNSYQRACTIAQPCPSCISKRKWHWDHYLRHFKAGIKDSETFLRFYLGKSNRGHANQVVTKVPVELLRTAVESEKIFAQFNKIYGPNFDYWCKDCNVSHFF